LENDFDIPQDAESSPGENDLRRHREKKQYRLFSRKKEEKQSFGTLETPRSTNISLEPQLIPAEEGGTPTGKEMLVTPSEEHGGSEKIRNIFDGELGRNELFSSPYVFEEGEDALESTEIEVEVDNIEEYVVRDERKGKLKSLRKGLQKLSRNKQQLDETPNLLSAASVRVVTPKKENKDNNNGVLGGLISTISFKAPNARKSDHQDVDETTVEDDSDEGDERNEGNSKYFCCH